jgi:hypothetical protein
MVSFKSLIYDQFPRRFREEDTYIDQNGKGLFRRFIETMGDEWDQELSGKLENYLDLFSVLDTDSKYLVHLAWFLGNPPDMLYSDVRYRRLLRYLMDINKCKGTLKSYDMIFFMLGVTVTLTIYPPKVMKYDIGTLKYDETLRYDEECPTCSDYDLAIHDPEGNQIAIGQALEQPGPGSAALLALLGAIIKYVEPINMRLMTLTYDGDPIVDPAWVLTTGTWDDSLKWADHKIYRDNP